MHVMAFLVHFSCSQTRVSNSVIEWTNGLIRNIWTLLLVLCNAISNFLAYAYPSASYPRLSSTTHMGEYGAGQSINEPIASYVPHGHETPGHASCTEVFGDRHSSFRYGKDQSQHELPYTNCLQHFARSGSSPTRVGVHACSPNSSHEPSPQFTWTRGHFFFLLFCCERTKLHTHLSTRPLVRSGTLEDGIRCISSLSWSPSVFSLIAIGT